MINSMNPRGFKPDDNSFNYSTFDTPMARMLTVGGIVDNENVSDKIEESGVYDLSFIQRAEGMATISVPQLTQREKQWIDSNMQNGECDVEHKFEIDPAMLANYVRYYREYPSYVESIV